jgi:hypothetical protein
VFEEALTKVLSRLEAARVQGLLGDYALIGGFAVAAWGVPRATQEIDFAVESRRDTGCVGRVGSTRR